MAKKQKRRQGPNSSPSHIHNSAGPKSGPGANFTSPPWQNWDRQIFAAVLFAVSAIYLWTMWPSVGGGDSGELTAAAYTMGIVHPPGYPLYTLIAHLFTYLPFGTVAWRVNLLSVVMSLASLALLFLIIRRLTSQTIVAAVSTSVIAFSPLYWRYSVVAEVFSLNSFFVVLLLYLTLRFYDEKKPSYVYWLAFIFGLGLCHHHTLLFMGTPLGIWLLWQEPEYRRPKNLAKISVLFLIGLTPYFYLYWSSLRIPLIAWGDLTTWDGFMTHLLRKEYGTFRLATEGTNSFQLLWGFWYFVVNLGQNTLYAGLGLVVAGIVALWKGPKGWPNGFARLLLFIPAFYLGVFHILANLPFVDGAALYRDIVSRFWIMPLLFSGIFFALGYCYLFDRINQNFKPILRGLAIASPILALVLNFSDENHHANYSVATFGRHMLENLPANSVFFTVGDINTNSVRYLQACENFRPDIAIIDRSLMSYPWNRRIVEKHFPGVTLPGTAYNPNLRGMFDFKRLFDANYDRYPIFLNMIRTKNSNEATDKAFESVYQLVPYGLSYRVVNRDKGFQFDDYIASSEKFLADPIAEFPKTPLKDSWDAVILENYWLAHHIRAAEILKYGLRTQNKTYLVMAERLLEDLVSRNKAPTADYFKNLGIAHQHLLKLSDGEERKHHEQRMLDVWETFITMTTIHDSIYEDIRTNLRAYGRIK